MSRLFILLFIIITYTGCVHSPKSMLTWRWNFDAVSMPSLNGFLDSVSNGYSEKSDIMQRFFLDDKLVLRKDNTCDMVLFKEYLHGSWDYVEKSRMLTLTSEAPGTSPISMQVDSISPIALALSMDNSVLDKLIPVYQQNLKGYAFFRQRGRFIFYLSADKEKYGNEKTDPYSKQNNLWRIKPSKPETDKQVLDRVDNHLQFWRLIVQDAIDRNKGYVSFHWFESPLVIASNGAELRSYHSEKDEWNLNFYDSKQALAGFKLLEKCFHKGLTAGTSDSRFQNDIFLIDQMIANLKK